jgi:outer membrane receptor protein involved in Fe transport
VAGQHNYVRQRDAIFLEPFRFDSLRDDGFSGQLPGTPLPGPVVIKRNYLPKNWRQDNSVQGTLVYERNSFAFRFTGSYANVRNPLGYSWPEAMQNMFWRKHRRQEERSAFANLQATHHVSASLSYNLAISYSHRKQRRFDPDFGDNWMLYADSAANAKHGYWGYQNRYISPKNYSTVFGYRFFHESFPVETYERNGQTSLGASLALTTQINKWWLLKAGSNLEAWTMRLYRVGSIPSALRLLFGPDGQFPRQFRNDYEREVELLKRGLIDYYGYDLKGRKTDSGRNAPHRPIFMVTYIQNQIEYGKLRANLGLRYERFDLKVPKPADLQNPAYDLRLDYIEENKLVRTKPSDDWLPRCSFSFSLLNRTELFAAYGKYVQMPALREIYISTRELSAHFSPYSRGRGGPVGFSAKPERSTHFEVGIRQALSKNALLTAAYFNKDFDNLLRPASVLGEPAPNQPQGAFLYTGWINRDQTQVRGLELTVTLQRTKRLAARVDYTFSKAEGTEADPSDLSDNYFRLSVPKFYRLDYNQEHRGAITLDYRFDRGDGGKVLEGLGLNVIMRFNSGHPYTQFAPLRSLGQSNVWEIGVRQLTDPYAGEAVEPPNSSTTPLNFNVDLSLSKRFNFNNWSAEFYCEALNFFNAKHKVNFYPHTGATEDDGWLTSPLARSYAAIPNKC